MAEQWRGLFLLYLRLTILFPLTLLQVLPFSLHKTVMSLNFLHLHSPPEYNDILLQAFMLMQTSMGEEEKEAEDSQEFPTEAVALVRGLIDSEQADGRVRASRIYVDDDEIELDVHDGVEQGTSKTIPGSLLEEGDMEKIVRVLDPPSPFAVYTTPSLRRETLFVEDSLGTQEQDNYGAQERDHRVREKTKDDTDYETADELGQEIKGQEEGEKQDSRHIDRPHIQANEEQESESKIKMS